MATTERVPDHVVAAIAHLLDVDAPIRIPYLVVGHHYRADDPGASPMVTLEQPVQVRSPPYSDGGHYVVAVQLADRDDRYWIDPFRLAHADCLECAGVWGKGAGRVLDLPDDDACLFALVELGSDECLVVHVDDVPDDWFESDQ